MSVYPFLVFMNPLTKIASLDLAAAEGARISSRTRWDEQGEACKSHFFSFEKKKWR